MDSNKQHTALNQLENWIIKFEKTNGAPTICEIKAQIEMFKEIEKKQIKDALVFGNLREFEQKTGEQYYIETFNQ